MSAVATLRNMRGNHVAIVYTRLASCYVNNIHFGIRPFGSAPSSSVDPKEVQRFETLSTQWANEGDSFKALHSFNQIRIPWIVNTIAKPNAEPIKRLRGVRLVDVGCGGGLLSIPLARLGASLCGIDASEEAIRAARIALSSAFHGSQPQPTSDVHLEWTTVEKFAENNAAGFDAVIASEVVEHVANVDTFVEACVRLARPGAPLFFTTINKTFASRIFAIWLAEEVFSIIPRGVHDWSKFIAPDVLRHKLEVNGCDVRLVHGITYNPLINRWSWTDCTAVNYALMAVRRHSS